MSRWNDKQLLITKHANHSNDDKSLNAQAKSNLKKKMRNVCTSHAMRIANVKRLNLSATTKENKIQKNTMRRKCVDQQWAMRWKRRSWKRHVEGHGKHTVFICALTKFDVSLLHFWRFQFSISLIENQLNEKKCSDKRCVHCNHNSQEKQENNFIMYANCFSLCFLAFFFPISNFCLSMARHHVGMFCFFILPNWKRYCVCFSGFSSVFSLLLFHFDTIDWHSHNKA